MFDSLRERDRIVSWIQKWFSNNSIEYAVIGISGGKDSTVAASLCEKALGRNRVVGVMMPNGDQSDIDDSKEVCNLYCCRSHVFRDVDLGDLVDISKIYDSVVETASQSYLRWCNRNEWAVDFSDPLCAKTKTNIAPRIRMIILYAFAQQIGGVVVNTCNLSEDYIGWSTKYGDAAGDIAILSHLTKTEVVQVGQALDIPDHLLHKAPADGLTGRTDEDNFGFSYEVLDSYIRTGECKDSSIKEKIDNLHAANLHKVEPIPHLDFE